MPGFERWSDLEKKEVQDVLDSGILMRYGFDALRNQQWKSREFEKALCNTFGCAHAQLTSSGTSALITALSVAGIGYGDEVILPVFTFVASFEAVISVGAIPVFADIDKSLTIDPDAAKQLITKNTKAIMPVHMCGAMADLDRLSVLCKQHNLLLIEDACQSIGGTYHGKYLGTYGNLGTLSFDFVKTITCGEGGVVLTNDPELYTKADHFTDHGHDHSAGPDRGADGHPFIGTNFRISELHAAVGLAQLQRLPEFLAIQKRNHQLLKEELAHIDGIEFRTIHDPAGDSCSFLSWSLPTEELTRSALASLATNNLSAGNFYWFDNNWHYIKGWHHLKSAGILPHLHPHHRQAIITNANRDFSKSDRIMSRFISTAISLNWTEEATRQRGKEMARSIHYQN